MIQIDIDMPRRCEECPLCVDYDCIIHQRITDEYYDGLNEQYAHCPLTMPSAQSTMGQVNDTVQSTNDCISRQAAIEVADAVWAVTGDKNVAKVWDQIKDLPSAQPEITRCKDCLMHGVCRFEQGLGLDGYCSQSERRQDALN